MISMASTPPLSPGPSPAETSILLAATAKSRAASRLPSRSVSPPSSPATSVLANPPLSALSPILSTTTSTPSSGLCPSPILTCPLYHQILLALQTEPAFSFARLLPQLRATLSDLNRKGRFTLLIVDEAHLLPPQLFDQLRFLLNDEMDSASLLTLVLLGQPDLAHKLRFAPYEALHQRIAVRYHLRPFDLEETAGYVKHHLRVAGCQNQIFSDSFVSGVYDHTKGVARKINNVCRSALLLGATEHKQILDETDLKRVILDLEGQTR